MLSYLTRKPVPKSHPEITPDQPPVLNDEDEKFLEKLTSEEAAPPLPPRPIVLFDNGPKVIEENASAEIPKVGKDAQIALMDGAEKLPLPASPSLDAEGKKLSASERRSRNYWAFLPTVQMPNMPSMPSLRARSKVCIHSYVILMLKCSVLVP